MTEDDVIAQHHAWLEQGGDRSPKHVQLQNLRSLIKRALELAWTAGFDSKGSEEAAKERTTIRRASQSSFGEGLSLGVASAALVPPSIPLVVEDRKPNLDLKPEPLIDSSPQTTEPS